MDLKPRDRIIVALDVNNLNDAKKLVRQLQGHATYFKIGLEAIYSFDYRELVRYIHLSGCKAFVDVKLHDIPNTVEGAAKAISELGVEMFNVHASAGVKAMEAAARQKGNSILIAVTVLTSHNELETCLIFGDNPEQKVIRFAHNAIDAGCDGIVCSSKELIALRKIAKFKNLLLIVPGIRPIWASKNDQERVMTPSEAFGLGANYIVVGRPITKSANPVAAFERIVDEIEPIFLQGGYSNE